MVFNYIVKKCSHFNQFKQFGPPLEMGIQLFSLLNRTLLENLTLEVLKLQSHLTILQE